KCNVALWRVVTRTTDDGLSLITVISEDLLTLCESRPDVQALIRAEVASTPLAAHGSNQHSAGLDIVNSTDGGNSQTYLLKRLKRDRPELAERVIRGELSASADRRLQRVAPAAMSSNQASPDAPESTQQSRVMPCPKDKKSPARWRGKQEIAVG
ncbi:MAG: hypothetical protein EB072_06150, partial [Betaproteobacteria bacterium]|nr:hypothetical protein [Betaproteobacteria bacterium]